MFAKLDELLDFMLSFGVPGSDCVVYHKGREVYRKQRGVSDLESRTPLTGNERYNIFSCSKPITCTAALQLWEKGGFKLDDELADYMPEYKDMQIRTAPGEDTTVPAKKRITIRNLFTMSAGFNYDGKVSALRRAYDITGGRCPTREVIRCLAEAPLDFEPGTSWAYSLCHDVLAALVEVVSGVEFNRYVTESIFAPLGMKDSTFLLPPEEYSTLPSLYTGSGETFRKLVYKDLSFGNEYMHFRFGPEYASGGAGCVSTVSDYIRFAEGLRTHVLLKPETVDMMSSDQLNEMEKAVASRFLGKHNYGLGVRCPKQLEDGSRTTDFGWTGSAGAIMAVDRECEFTLFYVQHNHLSPANNYRGEIVLRTKAALGY